MPQSRQKRVIEFLVEPCGGEKKRSIRHDSLLVEGNVVKTKKSDIPPCNVIETKRCSSIPLKVSGIKLRRPEIVGSVLQESKMPISLGTMPLKSVNLRSSSDSAKETIMQDVHTAPQFLSLLMGKGKIVKPKAKSLLLGRKVWSNREEDRSLSYAQWLQLFQSLLKEPLPFLELQGRFGISKQTIKRLVKNGLLMELWGPRSIGVRFKLTKKAEIYLKKLEAAAEYDPMIKKKPFIRLKHAIPF